ncbi:eCIS core domain-containing protein [Nitrospina gracilis]|uniref:eCIS core domain-containing protein n=1 Tax=Nitrospina gracilis TaxID=35801 RepID=UPI0016516375|nr:DUF4157 domain-containing protein [Nitrospina gracilis]
MESIEKVQRKSNGGGMTHVADPGTNARIQSPSGGRPLSSGLRSFVEPRLNQDFSNVRVHDAQQDREDATSLQARAFTYGNHIWVGKNESADDRRLMTHELVHVVQQGGGVKRKPAPEISKAPKRVQGGWWDDVKAAGSAFVEAVADPAEALRKAKDALLSKASEFVQEVPGFKLLTVILGKNPITDKTVDRNANNLIEGFLEFVPGGTKMFQNLKESGALQKAYDWLQEQLKKLNLGWSVIKGLFRKAWDAVSLSDIANPFGIFDKLKRIFMPPLIRIKNFAVAVGEKIIEFVFEGAMKLAGPLAQKVVGVFKQGKDVFSTIINDPVQFLKNLLSSVKGGFGQFKDNIVEHLKKGLFGWLFGALEGAGLTLPKKFDLKGILSITLQVLGLTYARVRTKLVKVIGEKRVTYIEKAIEVVKILVTEGLAGVWKKTAGLDRVVEGNRHRPDPQLGHHADCQGRGQKTGLAVQSRRRHHPGHPHHVRRDRVFHRAHKTDHRRGGIDIPVHRQNRPRPVGRGQKLCGADSEPNRAGGDQFSRQLCRTGRHLEKDQGHHQVHSEESGHGHQQTGQLHRGQGEGPVRQGQGGSGKSEAVVERAQDLHRGQEKAFHVF